MTHTVIETFDGSTAFKKDCRFIRGEFYIKNKQCFPIDGVWYRINSGFIIFDNEKQKWVVTKNNPELIKGIIGYDSRVNEIIMGSFTPNPYKNVLAFLPNGNQYICIDYRILPSSLFVEDPVLGIYNHVGLNRKLSKNFTSCYANNGYPFNLPYCCKHYEADIKTKFEEGFKNSTKSHKERVNLVNYGGVVGKYSFGVEFETNRGKIPNYRILESGLLPLRDGSINGIEFATLPLSGTEGVAALNDMCNMLKKYTNFTENESLHLHIGNIPTNKKFISYLYTLCCILEKDVYSIFPKYYAETSKFKARGKDYNMPLRKELVSINPDETFENLTFYLGAGKKYQGIGSAHPSDPNGDHKWGINERYHWVNFIPLLFGENKTLEFRCHVPTQDPVKVINWLYICSAIIKYAEKTYKDNANLLELKGLTLIDIIKDSFANIKLANYLSNYITERKANRKFDELGGDYTGRNEISVELANRIFYKDI